MMSKGFQDAAPSLIARSDKPNPSNQKVLMFGSGLPCHRQIDFLKMTQRVRSHEIGIVRTYGQRRFSNFADLTGNVTATVPVSTSGSSGIVAISTTVEATRPFIKITSFRC